LTTFDTVLRSRARTWNTSKGGGRYENVSSRKCKGANPLHVVRTVFVTVREGGVDVVVIVLVTGLVVTVLVPEVHDEVTRAKLAQKSLSSLQNPY
jgi:hypothetical protein